MSLSAFARELRRTRRSSRLHANRDPRDRFYFCLVEPKVGCHAWSFRLGAAAIDLILSFFGFLASRLPFCWPFATWVSLGFENSATWNAGTARSEDQLRQTRSENFIRPRQARRVQIVPGPEPRDHIQSAGTIEIVRLRNRPADARGPAIGIVKHKERHSRGPRSVQRPCAVDDHVPELIRRLEGL